MEVSYYPLEAKYGLLLSLHYEVKYPLVASIVRFFERLLHRGGGVRVNWESRGITIKDTWMQWFSKDSPLRIQIRNDTRWKVKVIVSVMYMAFGKSIEDMAKESINKPKLTIWWVMEGHRVVE